MSRLFGFPPFVSEGCGILVLGTFPGVKSLETGLYYANPHNHFWRILAQVYGVEVPGDYDQRIRLLLERGIGIWDVYASCEREGSLDQAIRSPETNDIPGLLRTHRSIGRVLLNGSKAYEVFTKMLRAADFALTGTEPARDIVLDGRTIRVYKLPSTSPVPSRRYRRVEDKFAEWSAALR